MRIHSTDPPAINGVIAPDELLAERTLVIHARTSESVGTPAAAASFSLGPPGVAISRSKASGPPNAIAMGCPTVEIGG